MTMFLLVVPEMMNPPIIAVSALHIVASGNVEKVLRWRAHLPELVLAWELGGPFRLPN